MGGDVPAPWVCEDDAVALALSLEPAVVGAVRDVLDRAGYSSEPIRQLLGELGSTHVTEHSRAAILRRTAEGSPLEVMLRLFLAHEPVPAAAAAAVLSPLTLDQAVDAGLLELDGDLARGAIRLRAFDGDPRGAVLASDVERRGAPSPDHVVGVGIASIGLSGMTVRRPIGRALDLGTGTGVQAMHASLHTDAVVATDSNPRAVNFARFNLALNDVDNVEVRQGDRFDPVAGEAFDLIVSNPPFVISPSRALQYRDSAMEADDLCRILVRAAPAHLAEGGWCQLLANWAYLRDDDWRPRLTSWFDGIGCDVWVLQRGVDDVEQYAAKWIDHAGESAGGFVPQFAEWMDYYERAGIEAVGFGLITLRRRTGATNWVRIEDLRGETDLVCGDTIAEGFELEDWVRANGSPERLLTSRLVTAPDVTIDQRSSPGPDGWSASTYEIALRRGLRRSGAIDVDVGRIVMASDGSRTVGDVVGDLARRLDLDPSEVAAGAVPLVLRLVAQGFLLPTAGG